MSRSRDWRVFAVAAFTAIAYILMAACAAPTGTEPTDRPSRDLAIGGSLLVCPTGSAQSASAIVGPAGGRIAVGASSITIPAGAVPTPTKFKMVVPSSRYVEVSITAGDAEHYEFAAPATVVIDYSRCGVLAVANSLLGVWYVDDVTKAPLEIMPASNDPLARKLTFRTGHLSSYAVAY
jgi:hypothetical protein